MRAWRSSVPGKATMTNTARVAAWLFLFAAWGGALRAQRVVIAAPSVEGIWLDRSGQLCVQSGRRVIRPDQSLQECRRIPSEAWSFDDDGRLLLVGTSGASGVLEHQGAQTWWRGPPPAAPVRLPLLLSGGAAWIPGRGEHVFFNGEAFTTVQAASLGSSSTGWGIGDTAQYGDRIPYALNWPEREGAVGLLIGAESLYRTYDRFGLRGEIHVPLDREEGILEFPHEVPPVLGAFGSSGERQLLVCDPSRGAAFLFAEPTDTTPRVLLLPGVLLSAVAVPGTDQRDELALVYARKPSLLDQLKILESGKIEAEVLLYTRGEDGLLKSSPTRRVPVSIRLSISVENELRRGTFLTYVRPLSSGVLVVHESGELVELPWEGDSIRRGSLTSGAPTAPFAGLLHREALHFLWKTAKDVRVMAWPLP